MCGNITGFKSEGHANYAVRGFDIICAAVSTLLQSVVLGLEKVVQHEITTGLNEDEGFLQCHLCATKNARKMLKAQCLMETMELSLLDIEKQYKDFVKVEVEII